MTRAGLVQRGSGKIGVLILARYLIFRRFNDNLASLMVRARKRTVRTTRFATRSPAPAAGAHRHIGRGAIGSMSCRRSFSMAPLARRSITTLDVASRLQRTSIYARWERQGPATGRNGLTTCILSTNLHSVSSQLQLRLIKLATKKSSTNFWGRR